MSMSGSARSLGSPEPNTSKAGGTTDNKHFASPTKATPQDLPSFFEGLCSYDTEARRISIKGLAKDVSQ